MTGLVYPVAACKPVELGRGAFRRGISGIDLTY